NPMDRYHREPTLAEVLSDPVTLAVMDADGVETFGERSARGGALPSDRPKNDSPPSSSACRMGSGVEFLDEFLQLGGIDVANCPEFEALCVPMSNVESL